MYIFINFFNTKYEIMLLTTPSSSAWTSLSWICPSFCPYPQWLPLHHWSTWQLLNPTSNIWSAVKCWPASSTKSGARNALAVSSGLRLTVWPRSDQPWSQKMVRHGPSNARDDAVARYPNSEWNPNVGLVCCTGNTWTSVLLLACNAAWNKKICIEFKT